MAAHESTPAKSPVAAHQPYVPDSAVMPEFTWSAVVVGAVLGIVFGASSLYLVLKVGLTVSASIPVAVLSITLFRVFAKVFGIRRATILENNIVQTAGSAGESIAFGIGVTMPAIMILGFDLEFTRVMLVAVLGGLLGIFMMIPLRRALIVQQHGLLKYPEGTACAEVLKAGASDESKAASSDEAKKKAAESDQAVSGARGHSHRACYARSISAHGSVSKRRPDPYGQPRPARCFPHELVVPGAQNIPIGPRKAW